METNPGICAVLVGTAPHKAGADHASTWFQHCPYAVTCTSTGRIIVALFCLPPSKRWWLELPQENPELLGLVQLAVFFTDQVDVSSPWSRGAVQPTSQIAPCGTDCDPCPQYRRRCEGCPATVYDLSRQPPETPEA